jgi:hypothetical protein
MPKKGKAADLVEPPLIPTGSLEPRYEKDSKNAKLASKPKVGETIIGDDGITGRIR